MAELYPNVVIGDPSLKLPTGIPYPQQRIGEQGDLITNMHGAMYEASRIGTLFYASTQATGKVTTLDIAAVYTGLALVNPAGNTKKFVLRAAGAATVVANATATIQVYSLFGGWSSAGVVTHTTALVAGTDFASLRLGGAELPTALVDSACTGVNPRRLMALGNIGLGTVPGTESSHYIDTQGAIVMLPGAWVGIATLLVSGAAGFIGSYWWEELPL